MTVKKRIAVFLDGTWNNVNDNTNVWRLKSLVAAVGGDGQPQLAYYHKGVGTAFGSYARGGMFGYGLNDEIIRAYEWLIDNYNAVDELFFSQGSLASAGWFPSARRCRSRNFTRVTTGKLRWRRSAISLGSKTQ